MANAAFNVLNSRVDNRDVVQVVVEVNEELIFELCDHFEADLRDGLSIHPAVYSLCLKLLKTVDPTLHFGVKKAA